MERLGIWPEHTQLVRAGAATLLLLPCEAHALCHKDPTVQGRLYWSAQCRQHMASCPSSGWSRQRRRRQKSVIWEVCAVRAGTGQAGRHEVDEEGLEHEGACGAACGGRGEKAG